MAYLTIAAMLVLILFPVLLPAVITLVHTLTPQPRTRAQRQGA
ncbi:hypothetical protein [Mycobacterium vicinigordonae]|nr:hypothetical protein [Mycobacterium vicinigordonae]